MRTALYIGLGVAGLLVLSRLGVLGGGAGGAPFWSVPPNVPKNQKRPTSSATSWISDLGGAAGAFFRNYNSTTKVPTGAGGVAPGGGTGTRPDPDGLMAPSWGPQPDDVYGDYA